MVNSPIDRRAVLAGLGGLALAPQFAHAKDYVDLEWADLVPEDQQIATSILQDFIDHAQTRLMNSQPAMSGVRDEWNGQSVRLPGYIIPLDYSGTGVTAFILAPFVGACIHVPPPPANQLVFVTTEEPYESAGLFEPVNVIGMFGTASTRTQLAEIAYALSADVIVPYER